jgi:hypothetical protein
MGVPEIEAFLTHLAVQERVAASTQNQALSVLLFLYRYILHQSLEDRIDAVRAKRSRTLPTVLTPEEAQSVIQQLSGVRNSLAAPPPGQPTFRRQSRPPGSPGRAWEQEHQAARFTQIYTPINSVLTTVQHSSL